MLIYLYVGFNLCYGFNQTTKEFIWEDGKAKVFNVKYCKDK